MDKLHYTEKEILHMTPRKYGIMLDAYIRYHGGGSKEKAAIDQLP